ncbi:MAG TPA: TIGR03560 family F420-dependent LLM class oxidoreductase [Chloroflexota bacterium]|nr:TIGR03560 family F420-dependent LLM class oxidoreductase [Chloroflexota bacterium]
MRFGLDVSQHQLEWREILHRAQLGEELGFDGVWVFDHFKPLYADPNGPCLEAYTLLAGLAAATSRVRLGALVTGATYRHPSLLATEAITVDHISNGRLELALGAAWFEQEHRELGFDFPPTRERVRRLEETIEVIRGLMTADNVTVHGRYFHLDNATYHPRPVQKPHPPIWLGASGEKLMLPLVARLADAWHNSGSAEEVIRKSKLLDELATEAGRDPGEIMRAGSVGLSDLSATATKLGRLSEGGFGYVVVDWPGEGEEQVRRFASEVMPSFVSPGG